MHAFIYIFNFSSIFSKTSLSKMQSDDKFLIYRAYIKVRFLSGASSSDILKELESTYQESAPKKTFVYKWYKRFQEEEEANIYDLPRSGRPVTKVTDPNILWVKSIIEEDPYVTYTEMIELTSLSNTTLQKIIHDELKMRKITSRWVPHELSVKNKKIG